MIRRFVNIVAENYSSNMYSLHRLDVAKHLFYPSTTTAAQAQELPAVAPSESLASIAGAGGGGAATADGDAAGVGCLYRDRIDGPTRSRSSG
jgi:hypothetical protein